MLKAWLDWGTWKLLARGKGKKSCFALKYLEHDWKLSWGVVQTIHFWCHKDRLQNVPTVTYMTRFGWSGLGVTSTSMLMWYVWEIQNWFAETYRANILLWELGWQVRTHTELCCASVLRTCKFHLNGVLLEWLVERHSFLIVWKLAALSYTHFIAFER